jgi:AbrB family looped-hinge helix DNA binding protein
MRITSKGQVTIPQEIREAAGFLPGTDVEFTLGDDGVVRLTHPAGTSPVATAIARLRGRAQAGLTTEEIMALTRGEG